MPKHLLKKRSPFFLFPFTLLLTLLLALPWASAKEPPKPKPEAWQINGIVAALDDGYDGVKKLAFDKFNEYDLKNLKLVVQKPEDIAQKAAKILKDKTVESPVRSRAASALGNLGEVNPTSKISLTSSRIKPLSLLFVPVQHRHWEIWERLPNPTSKISLTSSKLGCVTAV
ncbi:hypothetical protein [Nostoc sp.]